MTQGGSGGSASSRPPPSATTVKAILLDLDGTLLDTEALSDRAMYASLRTHIVVSPPPDHRLPWELKKQILGLRGAEWAPIVIDYAKRHWMQKEEELPQEEEEEPGRKQRRQQQQLPTAEQLWKDWEHNLNTYCDQVEACPGATEFVQAVAELDIPMAIATSSRVASVAKKRKNHRDMFRHFHEDNIICGEHVQNGKPAPDIYLLAAQRLNVHPTECLVIEDALTGVQAGKAAGCQVVAVPDPRFVKVERQKFADMADVVLEPDLWSFSGHRFGLDIDMASLRKKTQQNNA